MHFLDLNKLESNIILAKVHYKDQKKADGICFQPSFNWTVLESWAMMLNTFSNKMHTKHHTHLFFQAAFFCSNFMVWQLTLAQFLQVCDSWSSDEVKPQVIYKSDLSLISSRWQCT